MLSVSSVQQPVLLSAYRTEVETRPFHQALPPPPLPGIWQSPFGVFCCCCFYEFSYFVPMKVALFNNSVCVFVKERDRETEIDRNRERWGREGGGKREVWNRGRREAERRGDWLTTLSPVFPWDVIAFIVKNCIIFHCVTHQQLLLLAVGRNAAVGMGVLLSGFPVWRDPCSLTSCSFLFWY